MIYIIKQLLSFSCIITIAYSLLCLYKIDPLKRFIITMIFIVIFVIVNIPRATMKTMIRYEKAYDFPTFKHETIIRSFTAQIVLSIFILVFRSTQ